MISALTNVGTPGHMDYQVEGYGVTSRALPQARPAVPRLWISYDITPDIGKLLARIKGESLFMRVSAMIRYMRAMYWQGHVSDPLRLEARKTARRSLFARSVSRTGSSISIGSQSPRRTTFLPFYPQCRALLVTISTFHVNHLRKFFRKNSHG